MNTFVSTFNSLMDSTLFRIFFAAWTGFYLWQIIIGDEGPQFQDFAWLVVGFITAMVILGPKVNQGT